MGGRLGASPAPHGCSLENQTLCGLGKNLQAGRQVAAEPRDGLPLESPLSTCF